MGGADRDFRENDVAALQAVLGLGDHIAGFDFDFRAELFHGHDMQVDRPRADGAAAGQRNLGLAAARQQRPQHPEAGPHLGDEFIGRRGIGNGLGRDPQGFAAWPLWPGRLPEP